MKSNLVRAALVCAALALPATAAFATGDIPPIQGVPVGIEHDPSDEIIARGVTDGEGKVSFGNLPPGKYVAVIDGPGFVAAMDRLAPPAKKSSSGLSLGIGGGLGQGGGVFGGGSSHKSPSGGGAGPVGGAPGGASHGNSNSNGGGGMAAGIAIGDITADGNPDSVVQPGNQGNQQGTVTFTVTLTNPPAGTDVHQGTLMFSSETPYCRDSAGHGMRIGFTVPPNGIKLGPGDPVAPPPDDVTFTATVTTPVGGTW